VEIVSSDGALKTKRVSVDPRRMTSGAQVHGPHSAEVDGRERSAVDPLVEATADVLLVALAIETATGRMRTAELEERVTTIGAVEAVARRCLEQPPAETETETGTATVGLVAETETIPRIGDPVVVTETRPGARFGRLLAGMMTTTDAAVAEVPVRGGLARAKTVIVMMTTDAAVVEVPVPGGLARAKIVIVTVTTTTAAAAVAELVLGVLVRAKIVIVTMTAKEQEEKTIIGDVVLRRPLGLDVQAGLVIVIARTRMTIFAVGMTTVRTTAETEMTEKSPPAGTTAMNLLVVSKVELHRGDREPAKDHRRPPKEMPSQRNLRHPRRMSRRRPPSPSSRRPRNLILSLSVGLRSLWLMRRKMRLRSRRSSHRLRTFLHPLS